MAVDAPILASKVSFSSSRRFSFSLSSDFPPTKEPLGFFTSTLFFLASAPGTGDVFICCTGASYAVCAASSGSGESESAQVQIREGGKVLFR